MAAALAGVDAAYIAYYPDLAVPGAADTVGAFARAAARGRRAAGSCCSRAAASRRPSAPSARSPPRACH